MAVESLRPGRPTLHSELAQFCLPSAHKDRNQKIAWVNSICLLYLVIGLMGVRPPMPLVRDVSPIEEPLMVPIEPPPVQLAQTATEEPPPEDASDDLSDAPAVVAVTLDSPAVNFSVPTVGNLLVSATAAQAPPPRPMLQTLQPLTNKIFRLAFTGRSGDYPQPDYPADALRAKLSARMILLITVDPSGAIMEIKEEKWDGHRPLVDHTIRHIRRRFTFPSGEGERTFRLPVEYSPP